MNDRNQKMVRLYIESNWTYQEIADSFGVSRQRVGQVLGPLNLAPQVGEQRYQDRLQELRRSHTRIKAGASTASQEAEKLGYTDVRYMKEAMRRIGLRFPVKLKPARHGEYLRYHRGCRCSRCLKANRNRARSRQGTEPPNHGTESGYINFGCRCPFCKEARSIAERERKAEKRQRKESPQ